MSGTRSTGSNSNDENPLFSFIFGVICICFAIPMIWFNERKLVRMYKLFDDAKKAVIKDIAINEVRGANDLRLIHANGKTKTS